LKTIIDCLLFRGETVNPIPLEDVSEHIGDADNFIWIELASPDSRTITQLGDEFGLHELALEDAISIHQRTKLEEYGGHLFIAARTAQLWEGRIAIGETHLLPALISSSRYAMVRAATTSAFPNACAIANQKSGRERLMPFIWRWT
jgi:Mg2+ and Co2+ transporter CorA